MLGPTPLVLMADAVVSDVDNELLFLKFNETKVVSNRTVDQLMEVTASMNIFEDNSLYLFAKNNKFCKINTNDNRFVCKVEKINKLLKCNQYLSHLPEIEDQMEIRRPLNPSVEESSDWMVWLIVAILVAIVVIALIVISGVFYWKNRQEVNLKSSSNLGNPSSKSKGSPKK